MRRTSLRLLDEVDRPLRRAERLAQIDPQDPRAGARTLRARQRVGQGELLPSIVKDLNKSLKRVGKYVSSAQYNRRPDTDVWLIHVRGGLGDSRYEKASIELFPQLMIYYQDAGNYRYDDFELKDNVPGGREKARVIAGELRKRIEPTIKRVMAAYGIKLAKKPPSIGRFGKIYGKDEFMSFLARM